MLERKCLWCSGYYSATEHDNRSYYCSPRCTLDAQILVKGDDECWPWQGRTNKGYGLVRFRDGRFREAHRLAYELHVGPIPVGHVVRHSCDNPICCNYKSHLLTGTKWTNTIDAVVRGRLAHGIRHPQAKFTPELVIKFRQLYRDGRSCLSLAKEFSCCQGSMEKLIKGKTWRRVPGAIPKLRDRDGENNWRSKFTANQVRIICSMPLVIFSQADIARVMDCSPKSIWSICHGKRWGHLENMSR